MNKDFFTDAEKDSIIAAIKEAETCTSGEIQVHIESKCKKDVLDRASIVFSKLQMHKTELRNGILFYLAVSDRKFAILGDTGINKKVHKCFWDDIKSNMQEKFKEGRFVEGLCEGIRQTGVELKVHFPCAIDDINELPDELSFGDD